MLTKNLLIINFCGAFASFLMGILFTFTLIFMIIFNYLFFDSRFYFTLDFASGVYLVFCLILLVFPLKLMEIYLEAYKGLKNAN